MSTDAPTEVPRQSRDSGVAQHAMEDAARAAMTTPGQQLPKEKIDALNQSLVDTHVLPGLTIGAMTDTTPGNDIVENVTLAGDVVGSQHIQNAQYDKKNNTLTFERNPQLPGSRGGAPEHVTVNMLTGEETVTAEGDNGTHRTTTREYVGAPASTTAVTDSTGRVIQTEATNNSGATTTSQFKYNNDGSVQVSRPGEDPVTIKADQQPKVDPVTGVLTYKEGESTVTTTPEGRKFTTDKEGQTSYEARPGDNIWDISRDLLKVQKKNANDPNPNPSEEEILNMSNTLSKQYPNGIQAGETLNFGNDANLQNNQRTPEDPGFFVGPDGIGHFRGKDNQQFNVQNIAPDSVPRVDENGTLHYKNTSGQEVEVNNSGQETTTLENGTKIVRNKAGEEPVRYESKEGHIFEFHTSDNKWWYHRENGDYVPLGGPPHLNQDGSIYAEEAGGNIGYRHNVGTDGNYYRNMPALSFLGM